MFSSANNALTTDEIISLRTTASRSIDKAQRVIDTKGAELRSNPCGAYTMGEVFSLFATAIKSPLNLGSDYEGEYELADEEAALRIYNTASSIAYDVYMAAMQDEENAKDYAAFERDSKRGARNRAKRGN